MEKKTLGHGEVVVCGRDDVYLLQGRDGGKKHRIPLATKWTSTSVSTRAQTPSLRVTPSHTHIKMGGPL